jgi:hypothetical protein
MAGRSSSVSMVAAHRLFAPARPTHAADQGVELDEADVIWGAGTGTGSYSSPSPLLGDPYGRSPPSKAAQAPASVPVNIPDWSKILGAEYTGSAGVGARRQRRGRRRRAALGAAPRAAAVPGAVLLRA